MPSTFRDKVRTLARCVLVATITWSLLAFGAVYPWAYRPIFVMCFALAALVLLLRGGAAVGRGGISSHLALALALVMAAILTQLVPISRETVRQVSPGTDRFLMTYDLAYAQPAGPGLPDNDHPLSISPQRTRVGLLFAVSVVLLLWSSAVIASSGGARTIAKSVLVIGTLVAIFAIVQRATYNQKIYWVWEPIYTPHRAGGPFVNRNHFAGWLIMATSLALGYFGAQLEAAMRFIRPGWRNRLLWFATPDASAMLLNAFCTGVMALALFLTLSRSGILSFLAALAIGGYFLIQRRQGGFRIALAAVLAVVVIATAVIVTGGDALVTRFAGLPQGDIQSRLRAWGDGARISRDFLLVGTGFNTFGVATLTYQTTHLESHYNEAHNDYLQLLVEGGVLLAVPVALALALFVRDVRRRFRENRDSRMSYWIRAGAVTGLIGIGLQEIVDFSLQMPGNAVLCAVLGGIALHAGPVPVESTRT